MLMFEKVDHSVSRVQCGRANRVPKVQGVRVIPREDVELCMEQVPCVHGVSGKCEQNRDGAPVC